MTPPPLLTSATILAGVGYILYFTSSISAIADMGHLIGRGALLSLSMVIFALPALLYFFDKPITRHTQRMRDLREKARKKLPALHRGRANPAA